MRDLAEKTLVIDDLADRKHDADFLLDQNFFEEPEKRYIGLVSIDCKKLLGPKYALLRSEFRRARKFADMRQNGVSRILVYFGGSDLANVTGMTLNALGCKELRHLYVDIVVGPHNPHLESLKKQVNSRPRTRLNIQPDGFVELMLRADLFIGAGGSTTWERLCLNLPSIVVTTGIDQVPFTSELDRLEFVRYLGRKEDVSEKDIKSRVISELLELQTNHPLRGRVSLVDGLGALRVAESLVPSLEQELSLRPAGISDAATYFSWANDPVTRKQSFDQQVIPWQNHQAWFKKKIQSADSYMWVLETSERLPVGQIRFDVKDDIADIDYSLEPLVRGRGWAKKLLSEGLKTFKDHNGEKPLRGRVKEDNLPSRRVFQRLGFVEINDGRVILFYWP